MELLKRAGAKIIKEVTEHYAAVAEEFDKMGLDELADVHDEVLKAFAKGKVKIAALKTMIKDNVLSLIYNKVAEAMNLNPDIPFEDVLKLVKKMKVDVPASDLYEITARIYDVKKRKGIAM